MENDLLTSGKISGKAGEEYLFEVYFFRVFFFNFSVQNSSSLKFTGITVQSSDIIFTLKRHNSCY